MQGVLSLLKWVLVALHRWIGIATALLFVMWFASGLVMAYVPFPALTASERLAGEDPIDWGRVRLGPAQALKAADEDPGPGGVSLVMLDGAPVYRIGGDGGTVVSAVDGKLLDGVDAARAMRIAGRFARYGGPARATRIDHDQWTVSGDYADDGPLWRVSLADPAGTVLYVSSTTGAVVLDTTRAERLWNGVGAVPHWLYFTALRANGRLWTKVILWVSALGIVGAVTGLVDGFLRLRLRKRYAGGRVTPYRGWMKWHHVGGLVSGTVIIAWIVSGWLSMNPNNWFAQSSPDPAAMAAYAGAAGQPVPADLARLAGADVREARFATVAGRSLAVLRDGQGRRTVLNPMTGAPVKPDPAALFERARGLVPGGHLVSRQVLSAEDVYWYGAREPAPLPVLRAVFDDRKRTWIHIDAATGAVAGQLTAEDRAGRWAFNFLHDWDLPILVRHRPVWDLVLWTLSLGGLVSAVTGVVIGWRRLGQKAQAVRAWARPRRAPTAPSGSR